MRVTIKDIDYELGILNSNTNGNNSGVGTFYVGEAYGGYRLERTVNDGGGCSDITSRGTKKEIYYQIKAMNKMANIFCTEGCLKKKYQFRNSSEYFFVNGKTKGKNYEK
tara:strand:+ start:1354 stop:1680 length:327 start_codon:yes stop_codon:yes gene_type:complete